jgi:hypothetical protein
MDVRPPENETSLRAGDILLFHGHGFVSWALRRFDESDVDRAAIVLRPETMAEATASGLRHVAIGPAVDGNAFTYVRRLMADVDASPVAEQALAYSTDLPPTNDRIVLLAVLGMTRRLPLGEPTLRRLLCVLLDRAAGIVDRLNVRGRSVLFGSEFVYRCFERTGDPRMMIDVRLASGAGQERRPAPLTRPKKADAMLWEWASDIPDPKRRSSKRPKEPLEPLIATFARVDSPNDPIVPRSYVADAEIAEPAHPVDDGQLLAASVRFRDAMLRSGRGAGSAGAPRSEDPWGLFRKVVSFVTPGDLRYSHSLQTVTSLRPSIREGRDPAKRRTQAASAD